MTDRDRTAVNIENVIRDAELVAAVENLHGECFVEFPEINVIHGETVAFEELRDSEYRSNAHLVRLAACNGRAAIDAEWLEAALFGE